jgi:hypothetical protein
VRGYANDGVDYARARRNKIDSALKSREQVPLHDPRNGISVIGIGRVRDGRVCGAIVTEAKDQVPTAVVCQRGHVLCSLRSHHVGSDVNPVLEFNIEIFGWILDQVLKVDPNVCH